MSNIFRFPGAPEPTPKPERPTNTDPFALLNNLGRALIASVGDMTVGEALEKLARQPAKTVLRDIFGDVGDEPPTTGDSA